MLKTSSPQASTKEETMNAPLSTVPLMSGQDYRESRRRYRPTVFVDGCRVESVADEQAFRLNAHAE